MGTSALEFEKPINELEKLIEELRHSAEDKSFDMVAELEPLERRLGELRQEIYNNLTPVQKVQVARNSRRPDRRQLFLPGDSEHGRAGVDHL